MASTVGTNLNTLVERIANRARTLRSYTASGGSTTTATSSALWEPNGFHQGANLFIKGPTTVATVTATVSGGAVTALTLGAGGAGYLVAPTLSFSGGGGSGAACTPTVSGGAVTGFGAITGGSGYTSAPTVTVVPGAPQEQERPVSAYAVGTATVPYAFGASVAANMTLQLFSRWSRADIVAAINNAIKSAGGFWFQYVVDETLSTVVNQFSYDTSTLAAPIEPRFDIQALSVKYNLTYPTYPWHDVRDYIVRWNGSTATIQLQRQYPPSRAIRIEYIISPQTMTYGTDTHGVMDAQWLDDFIVEYALFELYQARAGLAPAQDKRNEMALAQQFRDEAERIRRNHCMRQPPTRTRAVTYRKPQDEGKYLAAWSTPGPT